MQNPVLDYADHGYQVFPCVTGGKRPLTQNGLLDATTDTDKIEGWLAQYPTANWAIRTEGLLVVDVDPGAEGWPQGAEQADSLAATPVIARTPRGGRHYWFRQPDGTDYRNTQGVLAEHVDTRANGGYVVVAPSAVNGNAYSWVNGAPEVGPDTLPPPPQWVLDQLAQRPAVKAIELPADDGTISDGKRNGSLTQLAGAMRRVGASEGDMLAALRNANATRCKPPLDDIEVATIAHSVTRYTPEELRQALAQLEALAIAADADDLPSDPGTLPDDLLTVPGFIADVVAFNLDGAFRRQPVLAMGAAITLLAALTGRKVTDTQGTRTNLYTLGVAGTSKGKERARQVNKEILYAAGLERMIGPESIGSAQGLITAVDLQPAILFQLDEFGRYLKTMRDSGDAFLYNIPSVLMRLFSSSASVYVSDAVVQQKKVKTIRQPHACVYGTTTDEALYGALNSSSISDGFLSRVLIFEGTDQPKRQQVEKVAIPQGIIDTAKAWRATTPGAGNTEEINPQPRVIETSQAASRIIVDLESFAEQEQRRIGEPLGSLWPRAVEKANKLALLYACSENHKQPTITDAAATWAVDVVSHLTERLVYLASRWLAENRQESNVKRLARIIEGTEFKGIDKSSLIRATQWLTKRERDEIIETLVSAGEIVPQQVETGHKPRTVYYHRRYAVALAA